MTTAVNGRDALDELRQRRAARRHRAGPDDAGDGRLGVSRRAARRSAARRHPAAGDVGRPEREGARDRRRRLRPQADRLPRAAAPASRASSDGPREQRLAAADRMAALGTLASGIAHEINNPLTYVIANLQTLAERAPRLDRPTDARACRSVVADALEGARADPQARQAGADGRRPASTRNGSRSWRCARRCRPRWRSPRTRSSTARTWSRDLDQDRPRARRPRAHRAAVRQPAAQRRPGDPRGARQRERGPRQRARAARPAARPSVEIEDTGRRHPARDPGADLPAVLHDQDRSGKGPGSGSRSAGASSPRSGGEISFPERAGGGTTFRVVLPTTDAGPHEAAPSSGWCRDGTPRPDRAIYRGDSFVSSSLLSRLRAAPTSVTGMFGFC